MNSSRSPARDEINSRGACFQPGTKPWFPGLRKLTEIVRHVIRRLLAEAPFWPAIAHAFQNIVLVRLRGE